tara:strand:- start:12953 stop:13279 length:327 start_codon:yes stop_codon:yes gene_type:complete
MQHHKDLPPSSAPALLQCPCYKSDSASTPAAERGTIIHECLGAALQGVGMPHSLQGEDMEEMLWALAYITKKRKVPGGVIVEELVSVKDRDNKTEISFGHADAHELEK